MKVPKQLKKLIEFAREHGINVQESGYREFEVWVRDDSVDVCYSVKETRETVIDYMRSKS